MSNADIVSVSRNAGIREEIASLDSGDSGVYSSIEGNDFESRLKVASAVTDSKPIREHLGKVIKLANVVIQAVSMVNEQTGEMEEVPRVILIDDAGNSFHAISGVILKDVQNLIGILGKPAEWPSPVKVAVKEEQSGNKRRFMTLTLA